MEAVRTSIFVPLHYLGYRVEKGVSADGTIVVIWAASIGACHDNSRVYSKIVLLSLKMAVNFPDFPDFPHCYLTLSP